MPVNVRRYVKKTTLPKRRRRRPEVVVRSKFKKEREYKALAVIAALIVVGGIGYGTWWGWQKTTHFLFTSPFFEIRSIEVSGMKNIAEKEIQTLLPFRVGDNMVRVWFSAPGAALKKAKPELKSVSITKTLHSVKVEVNERIPIARVFENGANLGIDGDNQPFPLRGSWAEEGVEILPEVAVAVSSDRKKLMFFIETLHRDQSSFYAEIRCFKWEHADTIVMQTKKGVNIYWGPPQPAVISEKMVQLAKVKEDALHRASQGLEYINLCYVDDGRVIVKPAKL